MQRAAVADHPHPRSRRRRWLSVLAVLLGIAVAAWLWLVPRAVTAVLVSRLQRAGFAGVQIDSTEVHFDRIVVRGLGLGTRAAGDGHLDVAAVSVAFTWSDVWHRHIGEVLLEQPVWTMAAGPGRGASPFDTLVPKTKDRAEPPATAVLPALPARRIVVRGGRIVPAEDRGLPPLDVDATFDLAAADWRIDLLAAAGGQRLQVATRVHEESGQAAATIAVSVGGEQPLALEGSARFAKHGGEPQLTLDLRRRPGPFELTWGETTWSGDGAFALQAQVPFAQLGEAALALQLQDLELASTSGLQIRGLSTDARVQGLPIPRSTSEQVVTWSSVKFAKVEAGSGRATFAVGDGPELHIALQQRATDEIGSLRIAAMPFAPGARTFPTTLEFDQVPLQEWLELLSRGRITGEGRLTGSLELVVHTDPHFSLDLERGHLSAGPGGRVRFLDDPDTEGMIRQHVEQIAAASGHDALVQDRLVTALKEFDYSQLEFRIDPESNGETLRVHAAGKGSKVPQALDVSINLHGFDTAVNTAIALKLGLDRAKRRVTDQPAEPPAAPRADPPPAGKDRSPHNQSPHNQSPNHQPPNEPPTDR